MTADTTTILIALVFTIIGMFIGVYLAESSTKCKYSRICTKYSADSFVCTKTAGMYYEDATRPAGCYMNLEDAQTKHKAYNSKVFKLGEVK
jgi:hypothetical protein